MTTIDLTDIRELLADRDMEIIGLRAERREHAARITALTAEVAALRPAPAEEGDIPDGNHP